jgi:myo-inositol 2-dehydrogenase / D-chiro-inositol 1-dehydrogenase
MPPIALNRRRFLGCSAAAGLALSQGSLGEATAEAATVRLGVIGLGTRGTSLLRSLLELPGTQVVALADAEPRHRARGQGIVEKARGVRPEAHESAARVLERADVDAVAVALPCDLHAAVYRDAIRAGKHLYAEKPLALTVAACDMLIAESARAPGVVVHVGFQRRSHPRYRDGVALVARGELGAPIAGHASWISSNGPMNGHDDWLARRARSGDWMVEQAAHVWDVYHWLKGGPPVRAFGQGSRDLFDSPPGRDVTDHYSVQLWWPDGFYVTFVQSWIAPADDRFTGITLQVLGTEGGLDFGSGAVTFRDKARPRQVLHPGNQADTRLALSAFLDAVRSGGDAPPPLTLAEARDATLTGLLVRRAVDGRRVVSIDEVRATVEDEADADRSIDPA